MFQAVPTGQRSNRRTRILLPMAVCASLVGMWAKWTVFYNRAKSADAAFSLARWAWQAFLLVTGLSGAAMLAWMSTTWNWYWNTLSWAGVAIAFLVSFIGLAFAFFLISMARYIWRNGRFWNAKTSLETQPTIAVIDREHTYLFLAPPNRELWKANVRLSRSCEKLQIRLDYSSFSGGVGRGYWRHRNQLLLKGESSYAKGQDIGVDLMCVDIPLWRWKVANGDELPLVSHTENQCRLVFIANGHIADDFTFLIKYNESTKPLLIGENNFAFARKWREEDQ